jgi:DNA-binding NarL/FixJ family response regulator
VRKIPTEPAIRIVIADNQALFRDGLRCLLQRETDLEVVGEAAVAREAVKLTHELRPDVLWVSLAMADHSALVAMREISAASLPVRILALAAVQDRLKVLEALRLGARGIVWKESGTQQLLDGIRAVTAGQHWG